jgi:hypothetical protein
VGNEDDAENDRWTGYYVAGQDWPAIRNDIPIADIYSALDSIDDEAVDAAMKSLRDTATPAGSQSPTQKG